MRFNILVTTFLLYLNCLTAQNDTINNVNLKEISITGTSKSKIIEQQAIKTTVLDVKAISNKVPDLTDLLNRTVGLRVRQTGGLGSNVNLMMNGFDGKSIKYFKDGIPMDYLGSAYSFSIVPTNQIERIEVYKGVLPISLGGDALGGGVNIVTRENLGQKNLNVSYQYGSFNTHKVSLTGGVTDASGKYFVNGNFFYNHSDNDYKVTVPIVETETGNKHNEKVRLFHNNFSNVFAEGFFGVRNMPWTKELRLGLTYFDVDRDNNYGFTMDKPYGKVKSKAHSLIPTLRYKENLFDNHLSIDQFLVYNNLHTSFIDTLKGTYDWHGKFTPLISRKGESDSKGNLTKLKYENFISRSNFSYKLNSMHTIEMNGVYTKVKRTGSNPFGETYPVSDIDLLSTPANYKKFVLALGLKSYFLEGNLSNSLLFKYFNAEGNGYYVVNNALAEKWNQLSTKRFGFGDAIKYSFSKYSFVRLSGESTVRLPEQAEFFGDGSFIITNFKIKPERSYNFNLGGYYSTPSSLVIDMNLFYRRTTDLIMLINTGVYGKYENVNNVKGLGLELDVAYTFFKRLKINGNMTYQDFRLFNQEDALYDKARLRNTPYFFANLGANVFFNNVLSKGDTFTAYWNYGFVRQYYLNTIPKKYEPDGFLGLWGKPKVDVKESLIPNQNIHSIGCTWQSKIKGNPAISFEMRNVFNSVVYDNYRVQNAGRSFSGKISFSI